MDLQIPELIVTATRKNNEVGTSVINRQAIQHIQPSGFSDLLELLPGYRWKKRDMSKINSIQLRQVGSDINTAFGTSFFVDGMPISTDGALQGNNLWGQGIKVQNRINVARGVDMREISTDDIESVEIIRGVPSVKHGNLSTGAIIIKRKWGSTPLTARLKTDLQNKVAALNKGVKLGNNRGIINLGTEVLHYKTDPRNPLTTYLRNKTSLRYSNHYTRGENTLTIKTGIAYLLTLNRDKADPELNYGMKDDYRSDLSETNLTFQSKLQMPGHLTKTFDLRIKTTYRKNTLLRERMVSLTGPRPLPISMEEGSDYAPFLPTQYAAHFKRDDRPINSFSTLTFSLSGIEPHIRHQFNSGLEWHYLKNFGKGDQFDITRPISPSSGGRPYDFSGVPALNRVAFFAEEELYINKHEHSLKIKPGIRISMLPGLNSAFAMQGQHYIDWRGHICYSLPAIKLTHKHIKLSFTGAVGQMTRMPALAHLYPQKNYFDIIELNYYSQNPELRQLYVKTKIKDLTNYQIHPVVNLKKEAGIEFEIGKTRISLSVFDEHMNNGIISSTRYTSYTYNHYQPESVLSGNLDSPPKIEQFTSEKRSRLFGYSKYVNGAELHKKGLEYQISTSQIKALNTRISINGAWFKTRYNISIPEYMSREFVYDGSHYPYVGIFATTNKSKEKEMLNTNLRFDTHVPRHRLLITLSFQTTWYREDRHLPYDGTPIAYLDNYGKYHQYSEADKKDAMLKLLTRSFPPYYFNADTEPIDLGINIKLSKEIGKNLSFAFYVNNLITYLPDYKTITGATISRNSSPYFGMELKINI
ncbi:MAG: TonB-dependent receptor plug domain-containing protein [Bacteroidales bacterium]